MKELSIEEKAKRYDEAIKVANKYKDTHIMFPQIKDEIFHELCESEDERIRKELISLVTWSTSYSASGVTKEDADNLITWLEKQGEIIKEWSEMKFNNIQTELQEMVDLKQKTEQGEQKPTDVSKQEDIELTEFEDALYTTFSDIWQDYMFGKEINVVDFVRKHSDELLKIANKQKPTEWSEEDKRKIDRIYSILRQAADTHAFSTSCRLIGDKECIELQDFLKSLRPQNTWKPSDEQMKFLWRYAEQNNYDGSVLTSLYNDLKKLKE